MNKDTSSEYSFSSEFECLSLTDPSEPGLSEREVIKRTNMALLAQIPCPAAQREEVRIFWGSTASNTLDKFPTEFDDFFMK